MRTTRSVCAAFVVAALVGPASAVAHPHTVAPSGQTLANGQNHGPFRSGVSCGGDPAAYGLETAHHGPDAGVPGKADPVEGSRQEERAACYQTTGSVAPGQDVESPVIR